MKKIPCLFLREFAGPAVANITREVTPGCEWVLSGEGTASRKWDGTACAVIGGKLFKRFDAKHGKAAPEGAVPCQPAPDPITGHWPHWVQVSPRNPADKHHVAAWAALVAREGVPADGTFELIGPTIGGNHEGVGELAFRRHGDEPLDVPRTFDGLRALLAAHLIEGVVFAHPDGRACKIRRNDFGLAWGSA
jgi:hypothetical protein